MVKYVVKYRDPDGPDFDGYLTDGDVWFHDREDAVEYDLIEAVSHVARLAVEEPHMCCFLIPVVPKRGSK